MKRIDRFVPRLVPRLVPPAVLLCSVAAGCTVTEPAPVSPEPDVLSLYSAMMEQPKAPARACDTRPRPKALPPNPNGCKNPNPDPKACGEWKPVGPVLKPPDGIADVGDSAQLYLWNDGNGTLCMYLIRNWTQGPNTANGVLCFDTKTCEVCAWDKSGRTPPADFTGLEAPPKIQRCSICHTAGPILPKEEMKDAVLKDPDGKALASLMRTCADKGGPKWLDTDETWAKPDPTKIVKGPKSCIQAGCHTGFIPGRPPNADMGDNPGDFCFIIASAFDKGGSMEGRFDNKADCEQFLKDMGCDKSQFTKDLCKNLFPPPPPPPPPGPCNSCDPADAGVPDAGIPDAMDAGAPQPDLVPIVETYDNVRVY